MNDSKFTLLPTQVTKTMAAFLNERLNERQKAELRALLGSGEGGAMTGEDISAALDAYFGDAAWRTPMTGDVIVEAVNGHLGSETWKLRAYERAPIHNAMLPANSIPEPIATFVNLEMYISFASWENGYVPDGASWVYLDSCTYTPDPLNVTWRFPTSLEGITVIEDTDFLMFPKLVEALTINPYWGNLPMARLLDCNSVTASWGFGTDATFEQIAILVSQGWLIYTPNYNTPESPWTSLSAAIGIPNKFQIDDIGNIHMAVGDGGITLAGDANTLYVNDTNSNDPEDWVEVTNGEFMWPLREEHFSPTENYRFFITNQSGTTYAHKP